MIVLLIALGANTSISSIQFQEDYRDALQTGVVNIGENLKETIDDMLDLGFNLNNIPGLNEICKDIVYRHESVDYCFVIDTNMSVLNHNDPSYIGKVVTGFTSLTVDSNQEVTVDMYSFNGNEFYDFALPLFDKNSKYIGSIRLGLPVDIIDAKLNQLVGKSILLLIASFVVAAMMSIVLIRSTTRPLRQLMEGTNELSKNNLDYTIEIKSNDEIGILASGFNRMAKDLKKSRGELEDYSKHLEKKIMERTKDIQTKVDELERFKKVVVGRELKMIELKNEIKEINTKLKEGHFNDLD